MGQIGRGDRPAQRPLAGVDSVGEHHEDLVGPDPAELVQAFAAEFDLLQRRRLQQCRGGRRTDDLIAVGEFDDPGRTIDDRTEVVALGRLDLAGVNPDADGQLQAATRLCELLATLELDRRGNRRTRRGERRPTAVAEVLDDGTVVGGDDLGDELVMVRQRAAHLDRFAFPPTRAVLDVGVQEGDDTCWQLNRRCRVHVHSQPHRAG